MQKDDLDAMNERVNIAINRMNGAYYFWARRRGIQENRLTVLYALSDSDEHTQAEISCAYLIPKTTVNTVALKLAQEGTIELRRAGKNKFMRLSLAGKESVFAELSELFAAEREAMRRTLEKHGAAFIAAQEDYAAALEELLRGDEQ